jgi:hypothetical protein
VACEAETWRDVTGATGYEVSDLGRVRSHRVRGRKGRLRSTSYQLSLRPGRGGYARVHIDGRIRFVHQLVLEAFVGPRPSGLLTRHLNGVPSDNRLVNLAWGSSGENASDAIRHRCSARRLSEAERASLAAVLPMESPRVVATQRSVLLIGGAIDDA